MKTIVCTGDSHTFGQGASGLIESFSPPVVNGDLRQPGFKYPCYVNLLRDYVNKATGSAAFEYNDIQPVKADEFARVQYMYDNQTHLPEIYTAAHEKVYRFEIYKGEYAVINSGIGSCTSERYLYEYFDKCVAPYSPSVIIAEAHSINDWLSRKSAEYCRISLYNLLMKMKSLGAVVYLLTVSPIFGAQKEPFGTDDYGNYVATSVAAAKDAEVEIIDANAEMNSQIFNMNEEQRAAYLFADGWHVNNTGHKIYADMIIEKLKNFLMNDNVGRYSF